jgi:hypothetical protein
MFAQKADNFSDASVFAIIRGAIRNANSRLLLCSRIYQIVSLVSNIDNEFPLWLRHELYQ